jgi:hypothetical protein
MCCPADSRIMESVMQSIQVDHAGDNRLRFVFNHSVMSFSVAPETTFGEVARTLGGLSSRRHGNPVAIDVKLKRCGVQFPLGGSE